jgi:acetylornithine/N-succinyldiaminopimelate aminotransferase
MILRVSMPISIPWLKAWVTVSLGGIIISPKIAPAYGMLGTTFGGNHLACAAGLAVLEVIERDNLMQNAAEIGGYLIEELKKFDKVKEVRGRGLMIGIDLPEELANVKERPAV